MPLNQRELTVPYRASLTASFSLHCGVASVLYDVSEGNTNQTNPNKSWRQAGWETNPNKSWIQGGTLEFESAAESAEPRRISAIPAKQHADTNGFRKDFVIVTSNELYSNRIVSV